MRIFSKIVFICNVCFIIAAILRVVELGMKKGNAIIPLPAIEGSIVILGFFVAIILNIIFVGLIIFKKVIKSPFTFSPFILWFNVVLLPVQIWYSFFKQY